MTDTELVDLSETITRCWANVDTELATLENETERTIAADPGQLQQLIENLVRNAAEHNDAESPRVTVTVAAPTRRGASIRR